MEEEKTKCSKMKGQNENGYEDGNEYDVFRRQGATESRITGLEKSLR